MEGGNDFDSVECATESLNGDTFRSTIYYWRKDLDECPEIVHARFGHESVHAIRWFVARKNGIYNIADQLKTFIIDLGNQENTPPLTPAKSEIRFGLVGKPDSGYLFEHETIGYVTAYLTGKFLIKEEQNGTFTSLALPCYARVISIDTAFNKPYLDPTSGRLYGLSKIVCQLKQNDDWTPATEYYVLDGLTVRTRSNRLTQRHKIY